MKRSMNIVLLFLLIFIITNLTACMGSYPCELRSRDNANYLEDAATEQGLNEYTNYTMWFDFVRFLYRERDFYTANLPVDYDVDILYQEVDHTQKFLIVPKCSQNEIVYVETEFPTYEELSAILRQYKTEKDYNITIDEFDPNNFTFIASEDDNVDVFLRYTIGSWILDEKDYTLIVEQASSDDFVIRTYFRDYNTGIITEDRILFFTLSDIKDHGDVTVCEGVMSSFCMLVDTTQTE